MNGAQALMKTLVDSGVEVCFSNPGTSEMHFVAALDHEIRICADHRHLAGHKVGQHVAIVFRLLGLVVEEALEQQLHGTTHRPRAGDGCRGSPA